MNYWNEDLLGKPIGIKDSDAVLDFPVDWNPWLNDMGATYVSHTTTKTGSIVIESSTHLSGIITTILSGGIVGETASYTVRITAIVGGVSQRIDDRTFYINIVNR